VPAFFTDHERWLLRRGLPHLIDGYAARTDVWTRAVPVLGALYLLGTLNALNADWSMAGNVAAFATAVAIAVLTWAGANRARGRPAFAAPSALGNVELAVFLGVPSALPLLFGGQWRSALVSLGAGTVLLVVIYVTVSYGLIPMTRWGIGRATDQVAAVGTLVARTLPLLLLLVTFLFINAEVWQVAGTLDGWRLGAVLLAFFGLGVGFLVSRLPADIRSLAQFSSWEEARRYAAEAPVAGDAVDESCPIPAPELSRRQWVNAGLVALVAQGVFVTAVAVVVFAFLVAFGGLTIPPGTQAGWTGLPEVPTLLPWLPVTRPLVQVSAFLAGFSALSFTVSLVQDERYRTEYREEVLAEVRQAFAARALARAAHTDR
jgi:hypothetical protein